MVYDKDINAATRNAVLSGGASGAAFGLGTALLARKKAAQVAMAALAGGGAGGALAGGSTYLGSKLMGAPDTNDPSGFTKRAGLGGAVGGGGIGAILGGLIGGTSAGQKLAPDVLMPYIKSLKGQRGAAIGAAIGALGLGGAAGYKGADEGMQLDFIRNQINDAKRKKMREAYGL